MALNHALFQHETQTALAVLYGRSRLLRRHVSRGEPDGVRVLADLDVIDQQLGVLRDLYDNLDRDYRSDDQIDAD